MGTYVYALRTKTRPHPTYGQVGVLYFLHKPAGWRDTRGERMDAMRLGRVKSLWKNRTIPQYVVYDRDTEMKRVFRYTGGCYWYDCDEHEMVLCSDTVSSQDSSTQVNQD